MVASALDIMVILTGVYHVVMVFIPLAKLNTPI